jgi:hypothetical protein
MLLHDMHAACCAVLCRPWSCLSAWSACASPGTPSPTPQRSRPWPRASSGTLRCRCAALHAAMQRVAHATCPPLEPCTGSPGHAGIQACRMLPQCGTQCRGTAALSSLCLMHGYSVMVPKVAFRVTRQGCLRGVYACPLGDRAPPLAAPLPSRCRCLTICRPATWKPTWWPAAPSSMRWSGGASGSWQRSSSYRCVQCRYCSCILADLPVGHAPTPTWPPAAVAGTSPPLGSSAKQALAALCLVMEAGTHGSQVACCNTGTSCGQLW